MSTPSGRLPALALAVMLALAPAASFAEQNAEADTRDEEAAGEQQAGQQKQIMPAIEVIRVRGQRIPHAYDETGSVVLLNRAAIERHQPLSTEDVLRRVPGINIKVEEETAIVSNFGIRGLSASESKALVLEDGVPIAPGLFIGNTRYFNTRIQRVERVEILKGSASLRYGPSTIGGVVNYVTKSPDDGILLSSRLGSFNLREVSVEAGNRSASGDGFAGLVATHARSDGFMDKGYEMSDVLLKSGLALNENQRIGLKLSYHDNTANISYRGLLLDDYRNGETYNPAPDDYYLQDRVAVDLTHEWDLSPDSHLKTLVYWSDVSRDYWRYRVNTAASNAAGRWVYTDNLTGNNRAFKRIGFETRLSVDRQLMGYDTQSEFGLRVMNEESDDRRIRATRDQDRTGVNDRHRVDEARSYAAYAQSRFVLSDRLAVTPGLRIESYEQKQTNLTQNNDSASTSNTELLPGVGLTFELSPSSQLYGGVYRAFSPASNGVALDGLTDQNLDGERSTNFEVGVRGSTGRIHYEVAGFLMDFSNQVVTGNSDPNLSQSNAGETLHYGMEFAFGYDLGGGFRIDSNLTWVPKSEFRTGDNRGNRLPYAPRYIANLALNYHTGDLSVSLMGHHLGEQYGDPTNQVELPEDAAGGIWGGLLPSYTIYDLMAQYTFNAHLSVFGSVKNLTDKRYIAGLREGIYRGPERAGELGLRYRF